MKKSHFHTAAWGFLLVASLFSYLYLKSIPAENYQAYTATEKSFASDQEDMEERKVLLPEVALVKKVIDLTQLFFENK